VQAEGSLEAEKLMIWRSYDAGPAYELARRLAGLSATPEPAAVAAVG
jgi:hypothetical protein